MSFVHIHTLVILPGVPFNVAPKHFYQDPRLSENKRKQNYYCTKAENNGFFLILSTIKGHVCFKLDEVVSFNGLQPLTLEVKFHFGYKLIILQNCLFKINVWVDPFW